MSGYLRDMEELLSSIISSKIRGYMNEAMTCYMAKAYRGCIVLSYIALFDDITDKLEELARVNSDAKKIFIDITKRKNEHGVYEKDLIDQLSSHRLIPKLDTDFLDILRQLRNKSAHPSGHNPSAEEARFIFSETITRFLSQPILSTTQLVDQIISRLPNNNFFPDNDPEQIRKIVADEISSLHEQAIPQLVAKLTEANSSSDINISKNARLFIVGLALQNRQIVNQNIQKKFLEKKSEISEYSKTILSILAANGSLFIDLTDTTTNRIHKIITTEIDKDEIPLARAYHPAYVIGLIAEYLSEEKFLKIFKSDLKKILKKHPYNQRILTKLILNKKTVFDIYFPIIFANAKSHEFNVANEFIAHISSLDEIVSSFATNEQAFLLIVAMIHAAEYDAYDAKSYVRYKFQKNSLIKRKAIDFIDISPDEAEKHIWDNLESEISASEFKAKYLD